MGALQISWQAVVAYAVGLVLLLLIGRLLLKPLKWGLKLVYNGIIGGIMLLVINWIGSIWSFSIPITIVTALVSGILGIPGVILLVVLRMFINF